MTNEEAVEVVGAVLKHHRRRQRLLLAASTVMLLVAVTMPLAAEWGLLDTWRCPGGSTYAVHDLSSNTFFCTDIAVPYPAAEPEEDPAHA